ncbi:Uncharacterised protein [Mycobacteroides abscessus subsp. abscessus]|nr:Uncharacterised protein [Mycobacteroides abscessus subsp. abscessus]
MTPGRGRGDATLGAQVVADPDVVDADRLEHHVLDAAGSRGDVHERQRVVPRVAVQEHRERPDLGNVREVADTETQYVRIEFGCTSDVGGIEDDVPHSHVTGVEPGDVARGPEFRQEQFLVPEHQLHPHPGIGADEVDELHHPTVGRLSGRARGDRDARGIQSCRRSVESALGSHVPAHVGDIVVMAGTVARNLQSEHLRRILFPCRDIAGRPDDITELADSRHGSTTFRETRVIRGRARPQ